MQTMHIPKIITVLKIALFLLMLHLITMPVIYANDDENKKADKKKIITKERLIEHFKNEDVVDGYEINGSDIIKIIGEHDYPINIKNSIIIGGLDLSGGLIQETHIDDIELPDTWSEEYRKEFREKNRDKKYHVIENPITIVNSKIQHLLLLIMGQEISVRMENTFFKNRIDFSSSIFSEDADFSSSTFSGNADFSSSTFSGDADFSSSTFSGDADFFKSTYSRDADFSYSTFLGFAFFSSSTFSGDAEFSFSTFSEDAEFDGSTFSGKADFIVTLFSNLAYFHKTIFNSLIFDSVIIEKYADFRKTSIDKFNFKNISPTVITGRIDFRNANITEAHFQDIIFEKDVDFSAAEFGKLNNDGTVVFRFVTFESDAYFIGTKFYCDTAFERINFKEDANFTNANFKLKSYHLEVKSSINDSIKQELIDKFKAKPSKNKDTILIVDVTTDNTKVWTIATFTDNEKFISKELIEDENNTFVKELNKEEADKDRIIEFTTSYLGIVSRQRFCLSYLNFTKLIVSWEQFPGYNLWVSHNGDERIKSFVDIKNENKKMAEGFSKDEFRQPYTIDSLCEAIKDNNNHIGNDIKKEVHYNTIE